MNMSKADRLYVYAVASWIAALDGKVTDKEEAALDALGKALGIPEKPRQSADQVMRQIAKKADRPERFDLIKLRQKLDEFHGQAREMRLTAALERARESSRGEEPPEDDDDA